VVDLDARRRRAIAIILLAPVVIGLLFWVATYTPLFRARHIKVEGNAALSAAQVRTLAGVNDATNVFHMQEAPIETALEDSPWIADAVVRAELPHTIVLVVTERRPVGVIAAMGDTSILASDGTLLPVSLSAAAGLPTIHAGLGAPSPEQQAAAAAQLSALAPVVARQVTDVLVGQDGAVTLTLNSGTTVSIGDAVAQREKAEALRGVLRWAASKGVALTSIDVSAPGAPSATLSDGSTYTP
jgi:cell division protein FtsQ